MRHNQMARKRYNAAQAAARAADGSAAMDHDALPQGPPLSGPSNLPNPNSSYTNAILHSTRQTTTQVRNKGNVTIGHRIRMLLENMMPVKAPAHWSQDQAAVGKHCTV